MGVSKREMISCAATIRLVQLLYLSRQMEQTLVQVLGLSRQMALKQLSKQHPALSARPEAASARKTHFPRFMTSTAVDCLRLLFPAPLNLIAPLVETRTFMLKTAASAPAGVVAVTPRATENLKRCAPRKRSQPPPGLQPPRSAQSWSDSRNRARRVRRETAFAWRAYQHMQPTTMPAELKIPLTSTQKWLVAQKSFHVPPWPLGSQCLAVEHATFGDANAIHHLSRGLTRSLRHCQKTEKFQFLTLGFSTACSKNNDRLT